MTQLATRCSYGPACCRLVLFLVLVTMARSLPAQTDSVAKAASFPWYDGGQRTVKPVELQDPVTPQTPLSWTWDPSASSNSTGPWPIWDALQYLVWIILALVVLAIIYAWYRAVRMSGQSTWGADANQVSDERDDTTRIEHLPFQLDRPITDFVAAAREQYQLGNYRNAIIYLFSYQLVQLDRYRHIHLIKGKTNRQYLFEIRANQPLRKILRSTIDIFEDVFFGNYEIDRERFESVWHTLDEFEALVRKETS